MSALDRQSFRGFYRAAGRGLARVLACAVCALVAPGCPPVGTGAPGSCTRTDSRCIELGQGYQEYEYPMNCNYPARYSRSPCPAENRVGRCVQTTTISGTMSVVSVNYYLPETTADAERACQSEAMSLRTVRFTAE
jgi:hypothetical protein